jgi:hypothetical protein
VALEDLDLVNADFGHTVQASVGETVIDDELNGPKDRIPTRFEDVGGLLPGQALRPAGQENLTGKGHPFLAVAPGHGLDLDTMLRATDPARRITEIGLERPDWQILEQSLRLPVIRLLPLTTFGANRLTVTARFNVNDQSFRTANQHDANGAIHERLESFDLVQ